MKLINLKKMMPLAVFVLGILGAFATTSMQSSTIADDAPILGYVESPEDPCGTPVACNTSGNQACHVANDEDLPQAFAKDSPTSCAIEVYRP